MREKSHYTTILGQLQKRLNVVLSPLGFKKDGRSFWRKSEDVFHILDFQTSQWNYKNEGRFTVNILGVNEYISQLILKKPLSKNPKSGFPLINMRIGSLFESKLDLWWTVNSDTQVEDMETEFKSIIIPTALTLFERTKSLADWMNQVNSNAKIFGHLPIEVVKGLILAGQGKKRESIAILAKEFEGSKHEGISNWYSEVVASMNQ